MKIWRQRVICMCVSCLKMLWASVKLSWFLSMCFRERFSLFLQENIWHSAVWCDPCYLVCDCHANMNNQIVPGERGVVQVLWSRCSVPVVTNTVDRGSCFSKRVQEWENQSLLNYSRVQKRLIISIFSD